MPRETATSAIDACAKIVDATRQRPPLVPTEVHTANAPNWDAIANSFASLSAAFTWGSIILAIIAIVAAIAWGKIVTVAAEKEAKEEAKRCANAYIQEWLASEAPSLVQSHVEFLVDAKLGSGDDQQAADAMGVSA